MILKHREGQQPASIPKMQIEMKIPPTKICLPRKPSGEVKSDFINVAVRIRPAKERVRNSKYERRRVFTKYSHY